MCRQSEIYIRNFVQIPCKQSKSTIVAVGGIRVNITKPTWLRWSTPPPLRDPSCYLNSTYEFWSLEFQYGICYWTNKFSLVNGVFIFGLTLLFYLGRGWVYLCNKIWSYLEHICRWRFSSSCIDLNLSQPSSVHVKFFSFLMFLYSLTLIMLVDVEISFSIAMYLNFFVCYIQPTKVWMLAKVLKWGSLPSIYLI